MIIKNLSLSESVGNHSFDSFADGINLIYSKENTKGKTTFLRLLFYSLGYQIPSMKGLDFKTVQTKIEFTEKDHDYVAIRESYSLITISKDGEIKQSFSLPSRHVEFLSSIFGYTKIGVLENLLGFMYIDQEKGWTLLNRGTVIGRIKFSVEQLLASLKDTDISDLLERKKKLEYDKKKYNALLDLQLLKEQTLEDNKSGKIDSFFETTDLENEYIKSLARIDLEIKDLEKSIKRIDSAIDNDNRFKEYINSMMLRISVYGHEDGVLVTKDNIIGLKENYEFLNSRRIVLSIDLEKRKNTKKIIERKLFDERNKRYSNSIFKDSDNPFFAIDKSILSFNDVDQESVNMALDNTSKELRQTNRLIKTRVKNQNRFIDSIYKYVRQFSNELQFEEKVDWNKDFIFTTDLKSLSGAALQKIVVAFKVAFLKVVEKEMGTNLFLVLDSPKAKELDEKNTKLLMKLIDKHLSHNQVFIGSIYDDYKYNKKIVLKNKAIEPR